MYKQSGDEAVIFGPATWQCTEFTIQKRYQKKKNIKQKSFMIKVVKRAAGVAIKRFLKNLSNHYNMKENACLVCRTNGKGPHHRESVIYEIKCTRCDNVYTEETSKSAYTTGNKHTQSLNNFYSLYIFSI